MHRHSARCCSKRKTNRKLILIGDICGWIGAAIILAAYCLVSFEILNGGDLTYQAMNISGAGLMMILAIARSARPSIVVNAVWVIIGIIAVVNIISLVK